MRTKPISAIVAAAALATLWPAAASAQSTTNTADGTYVDTREDDDDGFPWGLLGLLGLLGLIPKKRHDHVHVDNRTDTHPR